MFKDFYTAYTYLDKHPIFAYYENNRPSTYSRFQNCLYIYVVKVNPDTNEIDDNYDLNTKIAVWLEAGPYLKDNVQAHDVDLDCGGDTFEEAIISLANLVQEYYTDDKEEALKRVKENYS